MSLEAGQTLVHYEILEPIGRGGPVSARTRIFFRALRRGLAEAKLRPQR